MKRKLKSDRGFTLAELFVVAIIMYWLPLPFPSLQVNLRKAVKQWIFRMSGRRMREVMMAAITRGDTSATYTKDSGQKIYKETDGTYSIMVTPLKQQKDDWQTPLPITIGGVSSECRRHILKRYSLDQRILRNYISSTDKYRE